MTGIGEAPAVRHGRNRFAFWHRQKVLLCPSETHAAYVIGEWFAVVVECTIEGADGNMCCRSCLSRA